MSNDRQVIKQTVPPAHPPEREGFWSRRVMRPIVNQLTQGVSPHKITLTLALGATLGVFPIFGITSLLCLLLGAPLKLNQVILQSANWMVTWVHPLLLIFFVRLGETLMGAEPMVFVPNELVAAFKASPEAFMKRFGMTGLHGILGWFLVAPLIFGTAWILMKCFLQRIIHRTQMEGGPHA